MKKVVFTVLAGLFLAGIVTSCTDTAKEDNKVYSIDKDEIKETDI